VGTGPLCVPILFLLWQPRAIRGGGKAPSSGPGDLAIPKDDEDSQDASPQENLDESKAGLLARLKEGFTGFLSY
jgi:hypothetical protein